jgi:hypothetical protein
MNTYETDTYAWAFEQAAHIRAGRFDLLDIENIAEEIEDVGNSAARELEHRLSILLAHLLKWQHQPNLKARSWALSIKEQRIRVAKVLRNNPSLKPHMDELLIDAYVLSKIGAAKQTGMDESVFPEVCPWTFEQITDDGFFPE